MTLTLSRRGVIRTVSFAAAIALTAAGLTWVSRREAAQARQALEYRYMQSVNDLTSHVQNIESGLTKALYAKTPEMLTGISSKLWREAGFAKNSLDSLPVEYLELQNTNKLLSQVGDYCVSLSKEFARGREITPEQRDNLLQLKQYCETMLGDVLAVSDGLRTGSISLSKVEDHINHDFDDSPQPANIAEGFLEFEEGFTAYPTLIYDGPFSDHILQKDPEHLKGKSNISRADARTKAAEVSGLEEASLADSNDEDSRMPSYVFTAEGAEVSITKKGGFLSYMLKSREIGEPSLSHEEGMARAQEFLNRLDVAPTRSTYYEVSGNIMTINFAYDQKEDQLLVYPDLIKVSVALDNGEITGFDARGFLTNHIYREIVSPKLTAEEARGSVSELLNVEKSQLCLIPTSGLGEVLCWEFKCKSDDGEDILVYVNAATGAEEQILILLISENGQLTL